MGVDEADLQVIDKKVILYYSMVQPVAPITQRYLVTF